MTPAPYRRAFPRCTNPFVYFCPKHCFPGPLTDISLPSPRLPRSYPFPLQGLPALPALPRVKPPSELPPWVPILGIRQCTWVQMSPQAQGPPFLEIVLGMVLPCLKGWALHKVVLISLFQIKYQSGTFLSQSYSSRLGRPIESRIQFLGTRRGGG